jgi:hypothetical protein
MNNFNKYESIFKVLKYKELMMQEEEKQRRIEEGRWRTLIAKRQVLKKLGVMDKEEEESEKNSDVGRGNDVDGFGSKPKSIIINRR